MRRSLEWLYPGLGIKRWLLLACAGGVLLVYSAIFAVGVLWSAQLIGERYEQQGYYTVVRHRDITRA